MSDLSAIRIVMIIASLAWPRDLTIPSVVTTTRDNHQAGELIVWSAAVRISVSDLQEFHLSTVFDEARH